MKQDESDGDLKFIETIGLGGKSGSYWKTNKKKIKNGEEYEGLIETPSYNLMLDIRVLRI